MGLNKSRLLRTLLQIAFGFTAGFLGASHGLPWYGFLVASVVWGCFLVVAFHFSIGVRNLGSFLAGRLVRFGLSSVAVGPFVIQWNGKAYQLYKRQQSTGGYCAMYPTDELHLVRRFAIFILGGLVAHAAIVAVGFAVLISWSGDVSDVFRTGSREIQYLALFALTVMALVSLVWPLVARSHYDSDAVQQLMRLLRTSERRLAAASLRTMCREVKGVSPSDYSLDDLKLLTSADTRLTLRKRNLIVRSLHHYDCGEMEASYQLALASVAAYEEWGHTDWATQSIYYVASYLAGRAGDVAKAKELLEAGDKLENTAPADRLSALSVIAYAEGRLEEAAELAEGAQNLARLTVQQDTPLSRFEQGMYLDYGQPLISSGSSVASVP